VIELSDLKLVYSSDLADNVIKAGNFDLTNNFMLIGGPCAVETEKQILDIAKQVKKSGANILRGGAYKPRTSPYSFAGLGLEGLKYLQEAGEAVTLPTVTEVMDTRDIETVCQYCDIMQIGTRNAHNYSLLREAGRQDKPVILKRGMNSTIEEWLCSVEYLLKEGKKNVILCERGIRTTETYTRNTLDLSAVCVVKKMTKIPVIVDISHATGRKDIMEDLCLASVMAGCDGLMLEVHTNPNKALCDGKQSLRPNEYSNIVFKVKETRKFYCVLHKSAV
jgi:3-deoxy-7-phosphoheptulonate synthase